VALELSSRGLTTIVLDRRDVATGSTAASTSMLQYEIDEPLTSLIEMIGKHDAQRAYLECARGIELVENATSAVGKSCGFKYSPSLQIAVKPTDVAKMMAEYQARVEAGFDVTWLNRSQLKKTWGIDGFGAILSTLGASVDPYALAIAALDTVVRRGGGSI
jgi:glycine/D-amino acid oxidase-like deaminating enzyme